MEVTIRTYQEHDIADMVRIWNEVLDAGDMFDYDEYLTVNSGREFFSRQTVTCVAEDNEGHIYGVYILHPNATGRRSHIANASYAVEAQSRGMHIGTSMVKDSLERAAAAGFRILQFNAVVEKNLSARHLYEKLGFKQLGVIEGGLLTSAGEYINICPYYINLKI